MHTGDGKTLVGLLMLQSKINEGKGPALYLCPNLQLAEQVCEQAVAFGVPHVRVESGINPLPTEFLRGKVLGISTAQFLFNGKSKFGTTSNTTKLGTVLLDDAHSCVDIIKAASTVVITKKTDYYRKILSLFSSDIEEQGHGTFADIQNGSGKAILPVPYWAWLKHISEISAILSEASEDENENSVRFAWPLIKDRLKYVDCYISGEKLELHPYFDIVETFHPFVAADSRIFMSATLSDDTFLIKDLGIQKDAVKNPLTDSVKRWSGEKMILIPSVMSGELDRDTIVNHIMNSVRGKFGTVVLVPSFQHAEQWETLGAMAATKETITEEIRKLKEKDFENVMVFANRYDGIDLPDDCCRVLIIDSLPSPENLQDLFFQEIRPEQKRAKIKIAQTIEQGLGRAVRGEKDYCVVILIGPRLVNEIMNVESANYFSPQTQKQIDIGLEIARISKEDISEDTRAKWLASMDSTIKQCINRDEGWKTFYSGRMEDLAPIESRGSDDLIEIIQIEKEAQRCAEANNSKKASALIQKIIDGFGLGSSEKGWYLQKMANYTSFHSVTDASVLQAAAHNQNRMLLRPRECVNIDLINLQSQKRLENVLEYVTRFKTYYKLQLEIDSALSNLRIGIHHDKFEASLQTLGTFLGFTCTRPDKEWKKGPDNLWAIATDRYILIECKNEVKETRKFIINSETGQMNNAIAWFKEVYGNKPCQNVMVSPTNKLDNDSTGRFNAIVKVLTSKGITALERDIRSYLKEFSKYELGELTTNVIQEFFDNHALNETNILDHYTEPVKIVSSK